MRQRIFFGVRHIKMWSIVPWIDSDEFGWGFTWLCFVLAKYTIIEVDEGE